METIREVFARHATPGDEPTDYVVAVAVDLEAREARVRQAIQPFVEFADGKGQAPSAAHWNSLREAYLAIPAKGA